MNDTSYRTMNWLRVLRNEYLTPWRHCVAIVDDFGDLLPVSTGAPINYHFCGWQYTRYGVMAY